MTSMEGSLFAVVVLPSPWPPPETVELLAKEDNGQRVALSVDSRGSFTAAFSEEGRIIQACTFASLDVEGASRHIICLTWSSTDIRFRINGVEIPPDAPDIQAFHLPSKGDRANPIAPVLPSLDLSAGGTEEECFFLSTLADIDRKVVNGDRYSLIRAAGLLRQLLLDRLVHVVNRKYRAPIEFSTIDFTTPPPIKPEVHWQTLDPSRFPGAPTVTCSLDQFLAAPCLQWKSTNATVKDLIRACANAKGGIHLGKAKTGEEQLLLDWDIVFSMAENEPSLSALAGICRVVLVGLRSLAENIMADGSPGD